MGVPRRVPKTIVFSGAAVFGALAALLTFYWPPSYQLRFPVPGFQFLAFDAAELIDVIAFLVFGPLVGFLTAIVHGVVLMAVARDVPFFGPLLKFSAVTSMLAGVWLGNRVFTSLLSGRGGGKVQSGIMAGLGLVTRVLVMTPINYLFLLYVFGDPRNPPANSFVNTYLGWIGVFNAIHAVISILIPYVVTVALLRAAPNLQARAWLSGTLKIIPLTKTTNTAKKQAPI